MGPGSRARTQPTSGRSRSGADGSRTVVRGLLYACNYASAGNGVWQLLGLKSAGDLEPEHQDIGPSLRPGMQHPHMACRYWGLVALAAGGSSG